MRGSADYVFNENLKFNPPLANAKNYPCSRFSILPTMSFSAFKKGISNFPSIFISRKPFYLQGRYAIANALINSGVEPAAAILLPSYHCRSLVEPAVFLRTKILFYHVDEKLRPDLQSIEELVENSFMPVKVIMITHYFGFPQPLDWIVEFCRRKDIVLIEDCAHAFYGSVNGQAIGSFGQFSIASPRKFLPVADGGVLVVNHGTGAELPILTSQSVASELKAAARAGVSIIGSLRKNGIAGDELVHGDEILKSPENDEVYDSDLKWFDPSKVGKAGLRVSALIINNTNHGFVCAQRRKNYQHWLDAVTGLIGCRPLFEELPDNVVPYMFPLIITKEPKIAFHILKLNGVPVWRWEDMAVSDCKIVNDYRQSLLQLPCHQNIAGNDIDWMASVLRLALTTESHKL
ncbi:MAG: DegT/DnrJ/EryC1/StrS family aminotransferase [Gammaproteobacteria bacterium]|nr:DegT/DnrJ/EryC1/StrS family aminotransferase [Gammaproteobacteria bacterium]